MLSKEELRMKFAQGATDGRARRARIVPISDNRTAIVGPMDAVLAVRYKGWVTAYRAWHREGQSIAKGMTALGLTHPKDVGKTDGYANRIIADEWREQTPTLDEF